MISFPSIKLTVNFIKDRKQVVAYSPALDISTVGKSEKHAKKRFQELVHIFLKDISERNVVAEVLTELGWRKITAPNRKSTWMPPDVHSINLKIPMVA
ncbi:MAG: hypothetical protein A3B11_02380 [Candidatus Taylorbacteria bacterium RIFCSPLOWO2_01_FULL_44_26]|uniref:HicB-like antitoxin of toxin-antitoxin system domain-containing protein n=2 Tax=Candidatus Tayloriibacteriota TaxID=1817919 RepID=A0A1G2MMS9_9BACT|nr:MAG: hypothetical protein A3D50_01420 [Candidatus Taylorbacteria bacterium RIFCSPHIGHO2_02_FULL_44_12]OHA30809.1 MAG: hypothetical protein A3B11_02380 [Candidatus Taylorbacteria bacterium RIFCSPLOWO2_01_FULL_44_26]